MWLTRWLGRVAWAAVVLLAVIGLAAVTRRTLDLAHLIPPTPPSGRGGAFDAGFAQYSLLTLLHILPGALFMVLGPLQLVHRIRDRHPWLHRLLGRVYVTASVIIGLTALVMSFTLSIGGTVETAATTVFALYFLVALAKGVWHVRRREIASHRAWMLRAFAIGLAVATIRPIVGLFFGLTTLLPQEFFGYAFWIGFTLHAVIAEGWISMTRARPRPVAATTRSGTPSSPSSRRSRPGPRRSCL